MDYQELAKIDVEKVNDLAMVETLLVQLMRDRRFEMAISFAVRYDELILQGVNLNEINNIEQAKELYKKTEKLKRLTRALDYESRSKPLIAERWKQLCFDELDNIKTIEDAKRAQGNILKGWVKLDRLITAKWDELCQGKIDTIKTLEHAEDFFDQTAVKGKARLLVRDILDKFYIDTANSTADFSEMIELVDRISQRIEVRIEIVEKLDKLRSDEIEKCELDSELYDDRSEFIKNLYKSTAIDKDFKIRNQSGDVVEFGPRGHMRSYYQAIDKKTKQFDERVFNNFCNSLTTHQLAIRAYYDKNRSSQEKDFALKKWNQLFVERVDTGVHTAKEAIQLLNQAPESCELVEKLKEIRDNFIESSTDLDELKELLDLAVRSHVDSDSVSYHIKEKIAEIKECNFKVEIEKLTNVEDALAFYKSAKSNDSPFLRLSCDKIDALISENIDKMSIDEMENAFSQIDYGFKSWYLLESQIEIAKYVDFVEKIETIKDGISLYVNSKNAKDKKIILEVIASRVSMSESLSELEEAYEYAREVCNKRILYSPIAKRHENLVYSRCSAKKLKS